MTRTQWGMLIAGAVLALIIAVPFFVDTAEAGCRKHPKHCYPQPTPTATVVVTATATATQTPVPTTDDDIDSCFFHPTNPCVEPTPTPTVVVVEPTPAPTPDVVETATPTPVATPTPEVQLPPSGVLPGAPNTGSAGLRAIVDNATPTWCYVRTSTYGDQVLICSGKYYGHIWK